MHLIALYQIYFHTQPSAKTHLHDAVNGDFGDVFHRFFLVVVVVVVVPFVAVAVVVVVELAVVTFCFQFFESLMSLSRTQTVSVRLVQLLSTMCPVGHLVQGLHLSRLFSVENVLPYNKIKKEIHVSYTTRIREKNIIMWKQNQFLNFTSTMLQDGLCSPVFLLCEKVRSKKGSK